jgi:hypothetical protein
MSADRRCTTRKTWKSALMRTLPWSLAFRCTGCVCTSDSLWRQTNGWIVHCCSVIACLLSRSELLNAGTYYVPGQLSRVYVYGSDSQRSACPCIQRQGSIGTPQTALRMICVRTSRKFAHGVTREYDPTASHRTVYV